MGVVTVSHVTHFYPACDRAVIVTSVFVCVSVCLSDLTPLRILKQNDSPEGSTD